MKDKSKIDLVSTEVAGLWSTYLSDTMTICMLKHFLKNLKDDDMRKILDLALKIADSHLPIIKDKFEQEGLPIPQGFNEDDIDETAPRLYTDPFYLTYLLAMSQYGMSNYTLILNHIARQDIREFFSTCITESVDLFNQIVDVLQTLGLYTKPPRVEFSKDIDFIDKQNYFSSGFLGKRRPLNAREITIIFASLRQNIIGGALITGFAQVAKSKEVGNYFFRGRDLAWKKVKDLNSFYTDEGMPIPSTSDSFVTDSTVSPFSDKLMLAQIVMLFGASIMQDGNGLGYSMRHDLLSHFSGSMFETGKYAEDGLDLMVKNKWLEQPPTAVSHSELAK